jgi:tryptophan 2,3-dioxygenase
MEKRDLTYGGYLKLDDLLACQAPLSREHDELLFIVIHQSAELWLKLCLHELGAVRRQIASDDLPPAFKMLSRVARAQLQLIQSWEVLSTMTPSDYIRLREHLGGSSGFQSFQYRMLEFVLVRGTARWSRFTATTLSTPTRFGRSWRGPASTTKPCDCCRAADWRFRSPR